MERGNDYISWLTIAAMIWGAGGIGIAVAAGFYIEALTAVLHVLIGIEALPPLLFKYGPKRLNMLEANLEVIVSDRSSVLQEVHELRAGGSLVESRSI